MEWNQGVGQRTPYHTRLSFRRIVLVCILSHLRLGMGVLICSEKSLENYFAGSWGYCTGVQGGVGLDFTKDHGVGIAGAFGVWIGAYIYLYISLEDGVEDRF